MFLRLKELLSLEIVLENGFLEKKFTYVKTSSKEILGMVIYDSMLKIDSGQWRGFLEKKIKRKKNKEDSPCT